MIRSSMEGQKWLNVMQTLGIAALMIAVSVLLGRELAGGLGLIAILIGSILIASQVFRTPARLAGVIALSPADAPGLFDVVRALARRAGLPRMPRLFLVPSAMMNAFTMGNRQEARLFVTSGLIDRLAQREVAGVLAHEIAHIKHNDLLLFRFAELVKQTTVLMSRFGWLLLIFAVPIYLAQGGGFPLALFALLLGAPLVSVVLQLALFRTREFSADLGAVELTGDPRGLASALHKIDRPAGGLFSVLLPVPRREASPLFRTHPATDERIRRLADLM